MKVVFPGLFIEINLAAIKDKCGSDGPCGCWVLYAIDACTADGSLADIKTGHLA